jgi:ADP-ribose pyrophosphatase YjhB (NUDIX family)
VAIFVKNKDNQILLIKRGVEPGKGKWALPSGFIESDESPEETALRELYEETGISGRIKRLIGVYSEPTETYGRVLLIAYEAEFVGGHPKPGSDTVEVGFFSKEEMPGIPFASHNAIIKDALAKPHG